MIAAVLTVYFILGIAFATGYSCDRRDSFPHFVTAAIGWPVLVLFLAGRLFRVVT